MTPHLPHHAHATGDHRTARIVAAFEGSLEAVPFIIVAGLIGFAPIGETASGMGIAAAFLAAIIAGAMVGGLADRRGLVAGPSLGLALMISAVLATLVRRGVLAADAAGTAMALSMVLTLGSGLLMAGLAVLGIGRMAPLVPYPVLAGLRNGTAVLLVLDQAREAFGLPAGGYGEIHPAAIIVTGITVAAMLQHAAALRLIPRIVLALVLGTATHHALGLLRWGRWMLGPLMGPLVPNLLRPHELWVGFAGLPALKLSVATGVLLPAMLSMTVYAALETVACASALHSETGERSSGRRDLLIVALANVLGGAVGALPAGGSLEETVAAVGIPVKRSRVTALLRSGFTLGIALLAMPLLAWVPRAVLAGIIIAAAAEVADLAILRQLAATARTGLRHRAEGVSNLLVVVSVAGVAVAFGLIAAVIIGVLLSLVVFVGAMARSPVRRRYDTPLGRSRTRRGEQETQALLRGAAAIEVIELQGAIFFGSADQVAGEIEHALAGGSSFIVLDFGRVHRVDLSGARGLLGTCERLWRDGRWLALASMRPGLPAWDFLSDLGLHSRVPANRMFATLEDAIESAESALLADRLGEVSDPVLSGPAALKSLGIPGSVVPALLQRMREVSFPPGNVIIRAGDNSRELFVLLEGRADVTLPVVRTGSGTESAVRSTRVATLASGTLFGEMALLSNAPRSADVVARNAVRCLRLDLVDDLAVLRTEQPDAAWHLLTAIASQIELNLRLADAAIASYEE